MGLYTRALQYCKNSFRISWITTQLFQFRVVLNGGMVLFVSPPLHISSNQSGMGTRNPFNQNRVPLYHMGYLTPTVVSRVKGISRIKMFSNRFHSFIDTILFFVFVYAHVHIYVVLLWDSGNWC